MERDDRRTKDEGNLKNKEGMSSEYNSNTSTTTIHSWFECTVCMEQCVRNKSKKSERTWVRQFFLDAENDYLERLSSVIVDAAIIFSFFRVCALGATPDRSEPLLFLPFFLPLLRNCFGTGHISPCLAFLFFMLFGAEMKIIENRCWKC